MRARKNPSIPSSPGSRWRPAPLARPKRSSSGSATASGVRARKASTCAFVLVLEDRAGRVQQHAAGRERRATARRAAATASRPAPSGREARRCSSTSGWRRTMPVAEHGASSSTASNGVPSHQACGIGGIGRAQLHALAQAQPEQAVAHAIQALRIDVQRGQAQRGIALEQVRGLAARRGAGVEHARARRRRQRIGDQLRRCRPAPRRRPRRSRATRRRRPACPGAVHRAGASSLVRLDAGLVQARTVVVARAAGDGSRAATSAARLRAGGERWRARRPASRGRSARAATAASARADRRAADLRAGRDAAAH